MVCPLPTREVEGRDGRYYMIGVSEKTQNPILWTSKDLVKWKQEKELSAEPFIHIEGYFTERVWFGAPKLFYDKDSDQYLITCMPARQEPPATKSGKP